MHELHIKLKNVDICPHLFRKWMKKLEKAKTMEKADEVLERLNAFGHKMSMLDHVGRLEFVRYFILIVLTTLSTSCNCRGRF